MKRNVHNLIFGQAFCGQPIPGYTDGFRDLTPAQREKERERQLSQKPACWLHLNGNPASPAV